MKGRMISCIAGCCLAWSGFTMAARAAGDVVIGPHDFQKWAAVIHRQCDGKLPGCYAFEVLQHGGNDGVSP